MANDVTALPGQETLIASWNALTRVSQGARRPYRRRITHGLTVAEPHGQTCVISAHRVGDSTVVRCLRRAYG
jgi:hypothetical protein